MQYSFVAHENMKVSWGLSIVLYYSLLSITKSPYDFYDFFYCIAVLMQLLFFDYIEILTYYRIT